MKKIIAVILISLFIASCTVSADMRFTLPVDSDTVTGTPQALAENEIIKLTVLNEGNIDTGNFDELQNNILYFDLILPGENGESVGASIDFGEFEDNKIYKVFAVPAFTSVNNDISDFSGSYQEIGYANLEKRKEYVKSIRAALDTGATAAAEELKTKGIYLGIDYEMYKKASPDKVAAIMVADKGRLSSEPDLKEMISFINDSVLADVLNESGDITEEYLSELITGDERYASVKKAYAGIPEGYRSNIVSDVSKKNFKTNNELKQALINSVVLNAFNHTNTNADNLYNILLDYAELTDPKLNLNTLASLGSAARSIAVSNLASKKYSTLDELKKAIEDIKQNDTITNAPQGGGGGGGGGGAGGGATRTGAVISAGSSEGLVPFTDMDAYKWAEDAVYYLLTKKIVSGYGDNTFRPANNITRAEFVKITVSCFFDEADAGEIPFTDVGRDKWYYKYIAAALVNRIVSGFSETEFGPDRLITRQDIAVVLYNTALKEELELDTKEAGITDDDQISEYAKPAVYALKNAGIINGYEDGCFKPKNNAKRAEAVQMVYNFLMKKGELENEE